MSVVIETTLGDITVDLYIDQRPASCLNFLKLCKMKYYNFNLFHTIRSGFIAQTGDPTGDGSGGESIWGLIEGSSKRFFSDEKMPKIRHNDAGLLSMVCTDDMMVGSQFFFTLGPDLDSLDGVHCVIGEVTEGHEVLTKLNEVICDETHRPYQDVRITHTVILEDPFNDLPGLSPPSRSPSPNEERLRGGRIAPDEEIDETKGKSHEEIQEIIEEKEAKARATILEIVGDLPDADIAPPENVLFVCKLNPVTTDDDLEIIFSRFGKIVSCEVIRDKKTGDSLQYAFIEFEDKKSCEDAYFKMDNVLIDDRRIHVDFSQSVSKMRWLGKGRGVQYFNNKDSKQTDFVNSQPNGSNSSARDKSKRQDYGKERESRDRMYRNVRRSDDRHGKSDRNRSRRSSSQKRDNTNNKNYREQRYVGRSSIKNENSIRHVNELSLLNKSLAKSSPTTYDKRNYSRSPVRREENKEHMGRGVRDNRSDKQNSKCHRNERDVEEESTFKEKNDNEEVAKLIMDYRRSISQETTRNEVEPHTPSPVSDKIEMVSKIIVKSKTKTKHVKRNKVKRKPSTSSSESETSDSSSSTSDSSSSGGQVKKKRARKTKKRYDLSSSSSSSSTSTTSTSSSSSSTSSSYSSSDSSMSTSESECDKKTSKRNENRKGSKKHIKRLMLT